MIQVPDYLCLAIPLIAIMLGFCAGFATCYQTDKEWNKHIQEEVDDERSQLLQTIQEETKGQWSKGWSDGWNASGARMKMFFVWFTEHGQTIEDIEKWYKETYENGK